MPTTYKSILSYLNDPSGDDLVIDIKGGVMTAAAGTYVDVYKPNGNDNQLWELEYEPVSGYHWIKSKLKDPATKKDLVIDIKGGSTGTKLDVWTKNVPPSDNQLWKFVEVYDPGLVGWYTIQSYVTHNPVIDITGWVVGTKPAKGTNLDVFPPKSAGYDNQLWQLV
jgi:hypothetical protein